MTIATAIPVAKASMLYFFDSSSTSGSRCVAPTYTNAPAERESNIPRFDPDSLLMNGHENNAPSGVVIAAAIKAYNEDFFLLYPDLMKSRNVTIPSGNS